MTAAPNTLRVSQQTAAMGDAPRLSPFARVANGVAHVTGRPITFALCCLIIVVWAASGPVFHYSDT